MDKKLKRIWAIVFRHLLMWPRNLEGLAEVFWWPSFDLFLWGLTSMYIANQLLTPNIFTNFFLGGIMLWVFIYRSQQDIGILFLWEVWDHNLLNILTTPISIAEYFCGVILVCLVKLIMTMSWMILLAYLLFSFNIFQAGFMLVPFAVNLILVGWSAGIVINGLIVQYGVRIQSLAWLLITLIQPFSAVVYPVSILPQWMQIVSRILPSSYIFEGMREVITYQTVSLDKIIAATILNLIYFTLALMYFYSSFRKALNNGMIVKFS